MGTKLEGFFEPKSIAIIGASNDLSKISGRSLRYLLKHGFKGSIFPINPKYAEIAGIRCYSDLLDVPREIDLAIITRPNKHVLDSLKSCSEKGVRSVVIFSSGFAETGKEGGEVQEAIKGFVRENNIRVLGPNCLGFVNIHQRVTATFGGSLERDHLIPGKVGFLSQSGAFSNLTFAVAQDQGIGFSHWISTGNEMDIDFSDCLEYLIHDDKTEVIAIFIEGLRDGKKFLQVADKAIETGKPLIALKVGTSKAGAKASLSHTGAMTGSDDAYDAVFNQKRIIRANSIEELIDYIFVLLNSPFPKGRNVGIITITGGGAILMADRLEECGLRIPPLEGLTKDKMLRIIPPFGSAVNPVDLTGQLIEGTDSISESIDILMTEDGIDVVVVFIGMLKNFKDDLIRDFEKAARMGRKPLAIVWMDPPPGAIVSLKDRGVPVFEDPIRCANAVSMLVKHAESVRRLESVHGATRKPRSVMKRISSARGIDVDEILNSYKQKRVVTEFSAKKVLNHYGMPIPKEEIVRSVPEAIRAADAIGYPIALKLLSPQISHRAKIGLIKLGIKGADELHHSYSYLSSRAKTLLPGIEIEGLLVQEMLPEGIEFLMGMKDDPIFGSVISFGIGGILTEIIRDVSFRIVPISKIDAEEMIMNLRGYQALTSTVTDYGGSEEIIKFLLRFSDLCLDLAGMIREIDVNPIILSKDGKAKVADALIVLG